MTDDFLREAISFLGIKEFKKSFIDDKRGSGRSTGLAFKYIAEAINNDNRWIQVKDHSYIKSHDMLLRDRIISILKKLELMEGWSHRSDSDGIFIMFKPYQTDPKEILKEHMSKIKENER